MMIMTCAYGKRYANQVHTQAVYGPNHAVSFSLKLCCDTTFSSYCKFEPINV
jgi:hypothetical protein